jgi:DNA mismatch repair protein MutS2
VVNPGGEKSRDVIQPGQWVEIEGFLRPGRVLRLIGTGRMAEVEVGGVTWKVEARRLRATPGARAAGERHERESRSSGVSLPVVDGGEVIDLHGLIVEDAMERLDKFVDNAIVNRSETLKIIHGHGSGRLRKAVRAYLDAHPHVIGYQFGAPWEGGLAVTVVRLGSARSSP